jgi:hypothetical protein
MEVLLVILIVFAVSGGLLSTVIARRPNVAVAATVFCGVFVQALPFLVLGGVISGLVATFVTPDRLARWLPRRRATSILAAGVGGAALPGCECGVVIVCCAADAQLARIHLGGPAAATATNYPDDTWLSVEGTVLPGSSTAASSFVPTISITSVTRVDRPANTYAY